MPADANYNAWNASIAQVIDDLYTGKLQPEDLNENLFTHYKDSMLHGAEKGFKTDFNKVNYDTPDYALLTKMKSNLYTFAGAKTYAHLKEINSLLYDSDGKQLPRTEFMNRASTFYKKLGITKAKYHHWLGVEYDTAVAQGQMARQWQTWMENIKAFPNLKYRTVGDAHVRYKHAILDGIVVAKGSAYCDKIIPIKDFGCRCDMDETDEPVSSSPPEFNYSTPFEGNVGKNGIVISKKHPYFPEAVTMQKRVQQRVDEFALAEHIGNNRRIYDQYKSDAEYSREFFDESSGGFFIKHQHADVMNADEKKAIDILVAHGERVIRPANYKEGYATTFEYLINDTKFEQKTIAGNIKQRTTEDVEKGMARANNVLLYFPEKFSLTEIKRGLGNVKKTSLLHSILVIAKNKKAIITKKEIIANDYSALDILK